MNPEQRKQNILQRLRNKQEEKTINNRFPKWHNENNPRTTNIIPIKYEGQTVNHIQVKEEIEKITKTQPWALDLLSKLSALNIISFVFEKKKPELKEALEELTNDIICLFYKTSLVWPNEVENLHELGAWLEEQQNNLKIGFSFLYFNHEKAILEYNDNIFQEKLMNSSKYPLEELVCEQTIVLDEHITEQLKNIELNSNN